MKKRILTWLSAVLCLTLCIPAGVYASDTTDTGADDYYYAKFTADEEMVDNLSDQDTMEVIFGGMQPGDERTFEVSIKNEFKEDTDWYLQNEILESLEDATQAAKSRGGGYTYLLTYNGTVLFDSEKVGGEGSDNEKDEDGNSLEGLHSATESLDEWVFLETLAKNKGGTIKLTVGLDGETQGNSYQETMAQLSIRFAVEVKEPEKKVIHKRKYVKTGDENNMMVFFLLAAVSGVGLLVLGIYGKQLRKKQDKEVSEQ